MYVFCVYIVGGVHCHFSDSPAFELFFFLFLSSAILCLPCIEIIPKDAARDQVSNVRRELETEKKQKRIVLELV